MCGYMDPVYPLPLQLCGQTLPWVQHGTHLGHELHQMCNMDMDISMKRAEFIETSVQIRETFGFARPEEILRAVQVYGMAQCSGTCLVTRLDNCVAHGPHVLNWRGIFPALHTPT